MTTIHMIPLDKLSASPSNVRKTNTKEGLDELVSSIEAHGLINNLYVKPVNGHGFEVIAGERRRKAMLILVKEKKLPADHPVPCVIADDETDVLEISAAENVIREAMHPADEFDAFKAMIDNGSSVEDVSARFGRSTVYVRQRLKLANVSPRILAAYRKEELSLECIMAFTVTDDHKAQERVWKEWSRFADYEREPENIRAMLTEQHIEASNKLAQFVGVKAYEKAGGSVIRDLFDDESEGWLADADLLNKLAMEKLVRAQGELIADGWKWVEIMPDIDYSTLQKYERLRPSRRLEDDEESYTGEQKAKSGCILAIGHGGKLEINAGRMKPEDAKAERKSEATRSKGKAAKGEKQESGLSAKLVEDLTAHRTAAIAALLSGKPHVALAAVVHSLALDTLYDYPQTTSCLSIKGTMTCYGGVTGIEEGAAEKAQAEATKAATKGMPKNPDKLWAWLIDRTDKELMAILAVCAACTVDAVVKGGGEPDAHSVQLAEALKLDMADYWQPTADSYFGRVSSAQIIAAVTEACGKAEAAPLAGMKKSELAANAEKKLKDRGWLPAILRKAA